MIWLYVPGSGWKLQPFFPAASGCVIPSSAPRQLFGFRGLQVAAGLLALLGLVWLTVRGFWAEVATEVLVATVAGALGLLSKNGKPGVTVCATDGARQEDPSDAFGRANVCGFQRTTPERSP
ncbi:hypothetical protein [Streptomyces sp. KL2]|uniref:hypothetical protein n=1 Tax=Streptomyces sp. KL2 TaxID=3050126 RepID=UPI00397D2532